MSLEFYKTQAGRRFYDGTMTRIADSLERIATSLEQRQKTPTELEEDIPASQELADYTQNLVNNALSDIEAITRSAADEVARQ
tara:strand:+ start:358 stop:606 length:249 start_codon:yes stop_codon:yes gene_type:complete